MKMWLRGHIHRCMEYYPTKPPYTVEVFNSKYNLFYISGAACNVCVGIYNKQTAERVSAVCNKIAQHYSK